MQRLLIAGAAVAAVLALAACGGSEETTGNPSAVAPPSGDTATVSVRQLAGTGRVLVDSTGQALYAADEEANDGVLCSDACLSFWMPLTLDPGAPTAGSVPGTLGVVERPDGTRQVTHDGKRLYSFTEDGPGEVTGDGFADAFDGQQFTWHVVRVGAAPAGEGAGTDGPPFDYAPER